MPPYRIEDGAGEGVDARLMRKQLSALRHSWPQVLEDRASGPDQVRILKDHRGRQVELRQRFLIEAGHEFAALDRAPCADVLPHRLERAAIGTHFVPFHSPREDAV